MLEVNRFKESYYKGQLVWVKGESGLRKIRLMYQLLRLCEVEDSQVLVLEANQFVDLVMRGIPRGFLANYRAVIIRYFENIPATEWSSFMKCLQIYEQLRFGYGVRLILTSANDVISSKSDSILALKPTVIQLAGGANEPGDLNERVHRLIEQASQMTEKRILRVSERAAAFLETVAPDWSDRELLELLLRGVFRSRGAILRFADLLPQNSLNLTVETTL